MSLDELLISTGVDSLIKLVHDKGKVEIGDAALELRLPRQTVEDWAKVLEGEGIIKIQYQLTKMLLVWASMAPEEYQKSAKTVSAKKSATEDKIESLISTVDKSTSELEDLKADFRVMKKKSEITLESIDAEGKEVLAMAQDIDRLVDEKEKKLAAFKKELGSLQNEMEGITAAQKKASAPKKGAKEDNAQAQVEMLKAAEAKLEGQLKEFQTKYDAVDRQISEVQSILQNDRTLDEIAHMKSAVADLQFAKAEMIKSVTSLRDEVKQISDEIEEMNRKLNEVELKKVSTANPKKLLAQLDEYSYAARQERDATLAELQKSLEMVRKQLQSYSQLQYQYQTLNARIGGIQNTYQKETEEIDQYVSELENAYKKYSKDLTGLSTAIEEEKKKYEAMHQKAKQIEMVLGQVETLKQQGDSLSIKLKGVLKEAQVVSMKAPTGTSSTKQAQGGGRSAVADNLPPDLVQRIKLTSAEEEEFEKKREELRGLIRKMWEDDMNRGG